MDRIKYVIVMKQLLWDLYVSISEIYMLVFAFIYMIYCFIKFNGIELYVKEIIKNFKLQLSSF